MKEIIESWTIDDIEGFYKDCKARKLIPMRFQEAIEWWNEQLKNYDDGN